MPLTSTLSSIAQRHCSAMNVLMDSFLERTHDYLVRKFSCGEVILLAKELKSLIAGRLRLNIVKSPA
jgi:hypothetical protein